jgi:hypothetical protein
LHIDASGVSSPDDLVPDDGVLFILVAPPTTKEYSIERATIEMILRELTLITG